MKRYRITIELDMDYDVESQEPFLKALKAQFSACLDEGVISSYCDDALDFDTYDLRVEVVEPPKKSEPDIPFGPSDGEARDAERQEFERERHLQGLTVRSPHALSQLVESMRASQGTWLQPEEYAGPRNAYNRKGEALLFDGSVRAVRAKLPDTAMSIPAYYTSKGRRVHGYLTYTDGVYRFHEQEKT